MNVSNVESIPGRLIEIHLQFEVGLPDHPKKAQVRNAVHRPQYIDDLVSGRLQPLEVVAIDFSLAALDRCGARAREQRVTLHRLAADLSDFPLPEDAFDCIINFNFLLRQLAPRIMAALKPGGVLIFETMTTDYLRFRPDFNRDFLLQPGELAAMFRGLRLLKYRETVLAGRETGRAVASLIACKDS